MNKRRAFVKSHTRESLSLQATHRPKIVTSGARTSFSWTFHRRPVKLYEAGRVSSSFSNFLDLTTLPAATSKSWTSQRGVLQRGRRGRRCSHLNLEAGSDGSRGFFGRLLRVFRPRRMRLPVCSASACGSHELCVTASPVLHKGLSSSLLLPCRLLLSPPADFFTCLDCLCWSSVKCADCEI